MNKQVTLYDVYANLKENNKNYDFLCINPVSYINCLTDSTEKIIFICKLKPSIKQPKIVNKIENTIEEINLDLTGNPLQDESYMNNSTIDIDITEVIQLADNKLWTDEEENYSYIDEEDARDLLMSCAMQDCKTGAIWALCSGTDAEKILMVHTEFNPKWNCRAIVYHMGSFLYSQIVFNDLLEKHKSYISNCGEVKIDISTFFTIDSNSSLKLNWTTTNPNSIHTFKDAKVTLYQSIFTSSIGSITEEFWCQLMALNEIRDSILKCKANKSNFGEYKCGSEMKLNSIKEQILKILTGNAPFIYGDDKLSHDIETVIGKAKIRNFQMTDQLWTVLKFCNSYNDLKDAFTYIFRCAVKCNIMDLPTSDSRLAVLIREISQQRIAVPCLTGSEPLELLLEIGLRKLSKDYEFIFSESKVCSSVDLNLNLKDNGQQTVKQQTKPRSTLYPGAAEVNKRDSLINLNDSNAATLSLTVGFQNTYFSAQDVEMKINKLAQVHLILEHLILMQTNLNLDNNSIFQCAVEQLKQPIIPFTQIQHSSFDKREFSIANDKILSHVKGRDPYAQKIVITSENNFKRVKNVFHFSIDSIFPTNIFPSLQSDDKSKNNIYNGFHYLKLETTNC